MAVDISIETDGVTGYKRLVINTGVIKVYAARTDSFSGDNVQNWAFRDGNSLTATALWDVTTVSGGSLLDPVATKRAEIVALLAMVDAQYFGASGNPILIAGTVTVNSNFGFDRSFHTSSTFINLTPNGARIACLGIEVLADINLQYLSISDDSAVGCLIEVYKDATVADVFTYNAIADSAQKGAIGTSANTATIVGATLLYAAQTNKDLGGVVYDLSKFNKIAPSLAIPSTKIIVCVTPLQNNTKVRLALNWKE
jgi:hypothetical protein